MLHKIACHITGGYQSAVIMARIVPSCIYQVYKCCSVSPHSIIENCDGLSPYTFNVVSMHLPNCACLLSIAHENGRYSFYAHIFNFLSPA